ncbi:MAG: chitobiase/beta-hexosaminidase C-terminal domain-containing protein [Lentimicrobiaceae bacterium]|nr:chitobiase/beta-hexosaminidase C-terminal domain-containing protein [Lentimicrobiaceae bacterium]
MRTFTILKNIFVSTLLLFLFTNVSFAQETTIFQDFEAAEWAGTGAGSYVNRTVTDALGSWSVSAVTSPTNPDLNDRKNGLRSARLRGNSSDAANLNRIEMLFDKPNGLGTVSFAYASYSGHSGGVIYLDYSTDGGANWISAGVTDPAPSWVSGGEVMLQASFSINIPGNARIRISKQVQSGSTSVNIDDIYITDFNQAGHVAAPIFTPPGGSYTGTVNVTIASATEGATIRYTLNGTDPDESSTLYSAPIAISTQTTLKAKAWKEGMEASPITTANYIFPQSVSTLAELRALAPEYTGGQNHGTTVFKYTGTATITHVQSFRNVRYIQDGTAAIMIYDDAGKLQSGLEVTDKVTNITGTLTSYFGMLQIIPAGPCDRAGYFGQVPATTILVSQLDDDHNNPAQAKVIKVEDVFYVQTGSFGQGRYYDLKQNNVVYDSVVYTDKYEATYIGDPIPTVAVNIHGICNFKGAIGIQTKNRIVPLDDLAAVPVKNISQAAIQLAPNPANSFVNIVTGTPMRLEVYGLLGNLMTTENLSEGTNTISVSNYPAGVYLMKLTDVSTGKSFMQKLVVR